METNADARKKSNIKYGHVELPEITPSIPDKSACYRTEEKVIKINIKCAIFTWVKSKKLHYRLKMRKSSQISSGKQIAQRPATTNEHVIATRNLHAWKLFVSLLKSVKTESLMNVTNKPISIH